MVKHKSRNLIRKTALLIAVFALAMFIISVMGYDTNIKDYTSPVKSLDNWKINGERCDLDSDSIEYTTTKPVVYTTIVSKDMTGKRLEFTTSHMIVHVYFDDKLTYSLEKSKFFNHTSGTAFNMVSIPEHMQGKELRVEVLNCYDDYKNPEKIEFIYGHTTSIYRYYVKKELADNIVNALLVLTSLMVLIGGIILIRYAKYIMEIIYLSIFELLIGIWAFCNSALVNIIVGNPGAMNTLIYYSLFLAPLFCLLYVRNSTYGANIKKNVVNTMMIVHCVFIVLATVLQIANIKDFFQILVIYHLILAAEVFIIGMFFVRNVKLEIREGKENRVDVILLLLFLGVIADLVSWNITYTYNTLFTRIGLYIYTTSVLLKYGKKAYGELKESMNNEELRQIAYSDQLTGLHNRNAFISRLANVDIEKVTIIAFDVNNLKHYNDYLGHDKGDELLICMADKLKAVFGDNAYRIGGDEYEVILENVSQEELWKMLEKFEAEEEAYNNSNSELYLQAAYGVGYYQGGETINDIMKMADQNMYTYKKFLKTKDEESDFHGKKL